MVESASKKMDPPARHICILHGSKDNQVICEVFLLLENISSYTILISKDVSPYSVFKECAVAVVLENGNVIEM